MLDRRSVECDNHDDEHRVDRLASFPTSTVVVSEATNKDTANARGKYQLTMAGIKHEYV